VRVVYDVSPLSHPLTGVGNYVRGSLGGLVEAAAGRHEIVAFAPTSFGGRKTIPEALEGIDVDSELLFAAAILHDTGLSAPAPGVDFTVTSARIALEVAETVGLSSAATETMRTAITLHHSPGVTLDDGPEAYLLSAAAAVDVIGLGRWKLPDALVASVLAERPRLGFKEEFRTRWAAHNVRIHHNGAKQFRHPVVGALDLSYCTLDLPTEDRSDLRLTIYTAEPGSASEDGLKLLASWAATNAASTASDGAAPATDRT